MGKSITDQYIPRGNLGPRSKRIIARRSDQILPKPRVVTVVARVSEGHLFLLPQIRILRSKPTSTKSNPHGAPQVSGCATRGVCPPSFSTLRIPQAKPRPSQHAHVALLVVNSFYVFAELVVFVFLCGLRWPRTTLCQRQYGQVGRLSSM